MSNLVKVENLRDHFTQLHKSALDPDTDLEIICAIFIACLLYTSPSPRD